MRAADEEAPEHSVAASGSAELGLPRAGVVLAGAEAEIGTDRATASEATRVLQRQYIAERGERADTGHLPQPPGLGIAGAGHRIDGVFQGADLRRDFREECEQRGERGGRCARTLATKAGVVDRMQQRGIEAAEAGQGFGVDTIALAVIRVDEPEL
jgi:hypothetical protein